MSSRTFVVENTLEFSDECLKDLSKIAKDLELFFREDDPLEDFRYELFNEDHMEWVGQWMYDPKAEKILKKHKVTGHVIFDQEGMIYGTKYVDGIPQDEEVCLCWKKVEK